MAVTPAQWRRAAAPCLPDPENWRWRQKLTYRTDSTWVLRGVLCEGSEIPNNCYVWVVRMPLFVPWDFLALSHGGRMRDGTTEDGRVLRGTGCAQDDPQEMQAKVRLALWEMGSERDALTAMSTVTRVEEAAYALLLLGKPAAARRSLAEPWYPDSERASTAEARTRRALILGLLDDSEAAAVEQLREWAAHTAEAIKVRL